MPTTLTLRFQKIDKFSNVIFIASGDKPEEKESFNLLTKFSKQLKSLNYDTFLPIYSSDNEFNYATVRTKKNLKYPNLVENSVYKITFDCKKRTKDDKNYINCYLRKLKLVKLAEPQDEGSDVELDM